MTKLANLELVVTAITPLTPRVTAYTFSAAEEGALLPLVSAGSHIQLPVAWNGLSEHRAFSLSQAPENRHEYQVAVLCDSDDGTAAAIRKSYSVGMHVQCPVPENNFPLHADASPALLIAGGIGITPLKSMVHTLLNRGRRFELHYAGRSVSEMAFVDELQALCGKRLHLYPSDQSTRLDVMHLLESVSGNTQIYVCGPASLIDEVQTNATLLGISSDCVHTEKFTKAAKGVQGECELLLNHSFKLVKVAQGQPLILALRDAGVGVCYDCCVGDCGTCAVRLLSGQVEHQDHVLTQEQRDNGMMCLCVSKITSKQAVLDL